MVSIFVSIYQFFNNIFRLFLYSSTYIENLIIVRDMYLLGYIPKDNRLYLADKELNVVSYSLLLSVLEYQTAVMRKDFDTAKEVRITHVY